MTTDNQIQTVEAIARFAASIYELRTTMATAALEREDLMRDAATLALAMKPRQAFAAFKRAAQLATELRRGKRLITQIRSQIESISK